MAGGLTNAKLMLGFWDKATMDDPNRGGHTPEVELHQATSSSMMLWVRADTGDDNIEPIDIVGLDWVVDDETGNVTLNIGYWPNDEETGWVVLASLDEEWLAERVAKEKVMQG